MIELKMDFNMGNLSAEVQLWDINLKQFKKATAIFDTGAHTTHIDTHVLKSLGYDLDNAEISYINTVGNSKIKINNIVLDNIKIGELELGATLVNFSELSDISSYLILGLNILKEFNINLDFKNGLISMEPNFDVNSKIPVDKFNKSSSRFGMWAINEKIIEIIQER